MQKDHRVIWGNKWANITVELPLCEIRKENYKYLGELFSARKCGICSKLLSVRGERQEPDRAAQIALGLCKLSLTFLGKKSNLTMAEALFYPLFTVRTLSQCTNRRSEREVSPKDAL